jgi:zinc and cadmium transporter
MRGIRDMTPGEQSVLAVGIASAVPVAGTLLFATGARALVDVIPKLVPFAVGAMVGAAVFHLLPEAFSRATNDAWVVLLAIAGLSTFALVDRMAHRAIGRGQARNGTSSGRLVMTVASDALHNLIDGILVATTFLEQPTLGVITAVAVALHEVPRELGTFALCVEGGLSIRRSLAITVFTAIVAVLGAVLVVVIGPAVSAFGIALVPFAAGNFLYLAGSILWDSREQLRKTRLRRAYALLILVGLLLTWLAA